MDINIRRPHLFTSDASDASDAAGARAIVTPYSLARPHDSGMCSRHLLHHHAASSGVVNTSAERLYCPAVRSIRSRPAAQLGYFVHVAPSHLRSLCRTRRCGTARTAASLPASCNRICSQFNNLYACMMNCHALATDVKRGERCEHFRQVGAKSTFDPAPNPYNPCPAALASTELVA